MDIRETDYKLLILPSLVVNDNAINVSVMMLNKAHVFVIRSKVLASKMPS